MSDALLGVSLLQQQGLGLAKPHRGGACASGAPSQEAELHKWRRSITVTRGR